MAILPKTATVLGLWLLLIPSIAMTQQDGTLDHFQQQIEIDRLKSENSRLEVDAINKSLESDKSGSHGNGYNPEAAVASGIEPSPPTPPRPVSRPDLQAWRAAHHRGPVPRREVIPQGDIDRYNQQLDRYNKALAKWNQQQQQLQSANSSGPKEAAPNTAAKPAASAPSVPVYHYNFRIKSGLIGRDFTRPLTPEEQSEIARQIEAEQKESPDSKPRSTPERNAVPSPRAEKRRPLSEMR